MSKHKMILDPDADGQQWLYRGCIIMKQIHPQLLRYCCYNVDDYVIDTTNTLACARAIIDQYLDKKI